MKTYKVQYAGCSHPATGQIFKNRTWLFIGPKVGNSFNFLKYTHKDKPVVCQKLTKDGFKNNININKDNFHSGL